jgi:integral membrane protein (TIGR01906 family)
VGPGAHARRIAGLWLVGAATAIVILGASIAPFLAPPVVRFEQDRAQAAAWTGYDAAQLDAVTGSILGDLVLWSGDFDVAVDGSPVLDDGERSHMRDVRGVFSGFWLAVLAGAVVLVTAARRSRGDAAARAAAWRAVGKGARALAVLIAVAGIFALVAFDAAFELFHRLFFSGNYTFDPATDKLVQVFPEAFWSEIAMLVGLVVIVVAVAVAWLASRRARLGGAAA